MCVHMSVDSCLRLVRVSQSVHVWGGEFPLYQFQVENTLIRGGVVHVVISSVHVCVWWVSFIPVSSREHINKRRRSTCSDF